MRHGVSNGKPELRSKRAGAALLRVANERPGARLNNGKELTWTG